MKVRRLLAALRAAAPLALALLAPHAVATDGDALVRDLIRTHFTAQVRDIALWIPSAALVALSPDDSEANHQGVVKMLAGYQVFFIARQRRDAAGDMKATPFADPAGHAQLRLPDGRVLAATPERDLPPHVLKFANACKPLFEQRASDFGKALQVVVFKFATPADEPRIDATRSTALALLIDDTPMVWHLPLAGAGPSAVDPDSGEKFPGSYAFNPYTGVPLKRE